MTNDPNISALCEIDLSPGTTMLPDNFEDLSEDIQIIKNISFRAKNLNIYFIY